MKHKAITAEAPDQFQQVAFHAKGITKIFGVGKDKVLTLDDVTVAIEENELFTLLGPSGCGKTNLLRLMPEVLDATAIRGLVVFQKGHLVAEIYGHGYDGTTPHILFSVS